jgi:hypothetical protein
MRPPTEYLDAKRTWSTGTHPFLCLADLPPLCFSVSSVVKVVQSTIIEE